MNAPDPRDSDRGYTLLELLAAMAIMSIAFAAIFAGLGMFLRTETVQRNQSQLDVSLRSYAEQLMGVTYVACATPATPTYAAVSVPRDVHNTATPSRSPSSTGTAICRPPGRHRVRAVTTRGCSRSPSN